MKPVNIYPTVVFDLNRKVSQFIDKLNELGQIDLDDNNHPYLISIEKNGPNFQATIVRNNKLENFVLNPRKQREPITSWNNNDGFKRPDRVADNIVNMSAEKKKRERSLRNESCDNIFYDLVENIMHKDISE